MASWCFHLENNVNRKSPCSKLWWADPRVTCVLSLSINFVQRWDWCSCYLWLCNWTSATSYMRCSMNIEYGNVRFYLNDLYLLRCYSDLRSSGGGRNKVLMMILAHLLPPLPLGFVKVGNFQIFITPLCCSRLHLSRTEAKLSLHRVRGIVCCTHVWTPMSVRP